MPATSDLAICPAAQKLLLIQCFESGGTRQEKELEGAKVVVDPFDVIQDANRRVDEARRVEQQMSHRELKKSPFLWAKRSSQRKTGFIWTGYLTVCRTAGVLVDQEAVALLLPG